MKTPALASSCLLVGIVITMLLVPAAQGASLRLEMAAGFDGFYSAERWLAVRIGIENHGAQVDGHVAITLGTRQFVQDISLPVPAKKRLQLDVILPKEQNTLHLALLTAGETLATAHAHLTRLPENAALIVVLTPDKSDYAFLLPQEEAGPKRQVVYASLADLPARWTGYDPVHAVILDMPAIAALRPPQRQALIRWLLLGGKLLFVARTPRSRAATLSRQLLALSPPGAIRGLAPTTVGLGSLVYTRSLPQASGRLTIAGAHTAWQAWLNAHPSGPAFSLAALDRQIVQRINTTPRGQTHMVGYLSGFLCLYVVAMAGFYGYLLPRGANPWWAYMTGGGVTLAFALLVFLLGFIAQRGAVSIWEATLVHVFPRSTNVYMTTSVTLLTPRKQRYQLHSAAAATSIYTDDMMPIRYAFAEQRTAIRVDFSMPMWANRRFFVERFPARSWFALRTSGTSATLSNRAPFPLHSCYRLSNHTVFRLPDVPAGETLAIASASAVVPYPLPARERPRLLSRTLAGYRSAMHRTASPGYVICAIDGSMPALTSPTHTVQHEGTTVLIFHLEQPIHF